MSVAPTNLIRALENVVLASGPELDPALIERAKLVAPLLHMIDDGSDEFAALSDLLKALAYKDSSHGK